MSWLFGSYRNQKGCVVCSSSMSIHLLVSAASSCYLALEHHSVTACEWGLTSAYVEDVSWSGWSLNLPRPYLPTHSQKNLSWATRSHCFLGAFTPVSRAVHTWSDPPRSMLISGVNRSFDILRTTSSHFSKLVAAGRQHYTKWITLIQGTTSASGH